MKKLISFLIAAIFLFNQTTFGVDSSDLLSALRPEKTRGTIAGRDIGQTLGGETHHSTARGRIMLLFDIDHTLLDRGKRSWLEFPTYKPFMELLKMAKELNAKVGLLTNNDYDKTYELVLQFIPPELRQNIILYVAGPLQKYTFDKKGWPIESRVRAGHYITPQEKETIFKAIDKTKRQYLRRLKTDRQNYEGLYPNFPFKEPEIEVRGKRKYGYVSFITVRAIPSRLWPLSRLEEDEVDERTLFIKELKSNLPPELRQKLWIRRGGITAVDISRRDTNKTAAISDIARSEKIKNENIIYFGDEFAPNEADAIVATTPTRCISVSANPDYDIPEALWAGKGPEATAQWINKVLTYAEKEGLAKAVDKAEDELLNSQIDRLSLTEFITRLREKGLVPDDAEGKPLMQQATALLKVLERFSGVITAATKSRDETLSIYELLDYVESSNVFDEYRAKKNLPAVMVFKGSIYREDNIKTSWRIVYTHCRDFDSFTTIYGDEANSDFILGLGGLKYYADIFNLKQVLPTMFVHNLQAADVIDIRNSLWGIPFNGASTSILHNSDSTATKEEVIREWSSALYSAGVLGRRYFAKPDRGTAEEEMEWIQEAADNSRREMEKMGIKTESYQPVATSIEIPHNKWMATGLSIIGTLSAAFKVLNIRKEKTSVIIFGFGNIAESTIRLLKSEGIKIVGVADSKRAVYDSKGLDPNRLLRLKRRGKQVADYDKDKVIAQHELLSKRATALLTLAVPSVITKDNYKWLKVRLIVDSVYSSLQRGVDMERLLQDEKSILYLPSSLSSGGGAWASSEEIFHKNADIDVHNMKNHILDTIRKTSFTTTVLLLKMWLASDKKLIPAHILRDIAESIRTRRNDLLENPTSEIEERAEYYALVGVPGRIAYLFASIGAAKDEILYKDEDTLNLCSILRDERTPPWEKAYAAYILGRKRDLRAKDALIAALHKKSLDKQSPHIRENVAEALGQIWAGGAIENLLAVYKDPAEKTGLKNWIGWSLEKMGVASHFVKRPHKSVTFKRAIQEIPRKIVRRYIYRKGRHIKRPVIIGISGFSASGKTYFVNKLLEKIKREFDRRLPGQDVKIVHLEIDDYLLAKEERLPRAERLGIPLSIFIKFEFQRFVNDIKRLAARKPIYVPHFDQVKRKRERADEDLMQEVRVLTEQGAKKVILEFEGEKHTLIRHEGLSKKENRGVYIDLQNGDILRELKPGVDIVVVAEGILALADKEAVNVYDEAVFMTAPWGLRLRRDIQRYIEQGKYASMTTEEVNAKFERKRIQEETKYISGQQDLATCLIDTSDAKVPAYVNAYLMVLEDFRTWINSLTTSYPEERITLEQRESKLSELFILYKLDRVKEAAPLYKVWTRLYQNLIISERSPVFKAVSDFVSEQNKEGWFTMDVAEKDKVIKGIIDEHKLYEDKNIKLMFLHSVQPPDMIVKAAKKVIKRKRVKPERQRRPAVLEGLSATAEKSIAVKLLSIFAPHRMDLLDEMLGSVDYTRLVVTGEIRDIDKFIHVCMNLGIFKDSKMKYRFIFMHEAVHFLQRKGIIPLVKYEKDVDGQRELVPALVELALFFFEISNKEEFSEFLTRFFKAEPEVEYGMEVYRGATSEKEILRDLDHKFADYMEETQTMFTDEDTRDDAETWRRRAPKDWQYFLAHIVSGMAYAYALNRRDPEKLWDYVIAFIKYGGERLKLSEDDIRYALDGFKTSGLSKIPFKSEPYSSAKSSSAGRIKSSPAGDKNDIEKIYASPIELVRHIIGLSFEEIDITSAKKDLAAISRRFEDMKVNFTMKPQIMEGIDFESPLPSSLLNFSFDPEDKESILTTPAYWRLAEYIKSKRTEPEKGKYDIDPVLTYADPLYIEDLLSEEDVADIERLCYCPSFLIRRKAIRCLGIIYGVKEELVSKERLLALTIDVLIQDVLDDIYYLEKVFKDTRFLKETGINIFGRPIEKGQVKQVGVKFFGTGTEKLIYKISVLLKDKPKPLVFVIGSMRPNDAATGGWETDRLQGADRRIIAMSHQNWRGLIKLKNPALPALGGIVDFKIPEPVATVETYIGDENGSIPGKLYLRREKEVVLYSVEFIEGETLDQILRDPGLPYGKREDMAVNSIYNTLKIWLDTVNKDGLGIVLRDPHPNNFIYQKGKFKSIDNERLIYGYTFEECVREILGWMERQKSDPLLLSKALLKLADEALRRRINLAPSERVLQARDEARVVAALGGDMDTRFIPGTRSFDIDEALGSQRMTESIQNEISSYENIRQAA